MSEVQEIAEWLIDMGYPGDFTFTNRPPAALWEALVDYVYEDRTGQWHDNDLSRDEVDAWLRYEGGFTR